MTIIKHLYTNSSLWVRIYLNSLTRGCSGCTHTRLLQWDGYEHGTPDGWRWQWCENGGYVLSHEKTPPTGESKLSMRFWLAASWRSLTCFCSSIASACPAGTSDLEKKDLAICVIQAKLVIAAIYSFSCYVSSQYLHSQIERKGQLESSLL